MLISRPIVPKVDIGNVGSIVDNYCCCVVWHSPYFRGGAAKIFKKILFYQSYIISSYWDRYSWYQSEVASLDK